MSARASTAMAAIRPLQAALLFAALLFCGTAAVANTATLPTVPYEPTPQEVVDKMLDMASVGKDDVVYDLGCGDGRIVISAAKDRGARGVGIDRDPVRIAEAMENLRAAGVQGRVRFIQGDLFKADFAEATVVTLYLLPTVNVALRPQLWRQLRVGTRVVSHAFDMGPDWPPERTETIDGRTVYFWTITEANKKAAAA